jgi:hypothetical protein
MLRAEINLVGPGEGSTATVPLYEVPAYFCEECPLPKSVIIDHSGVYCKLGEEMNCLISSNPRNEEQWRRVIVQAACNPPVIVTHN